jgi:hypothetical protein
MQQSSDEIREEIAETRARIDQDIDALQSKLKQTTDPLERLQEMPLIPLVVGAIGVGVLAAALLVRRRPNEPPLPPRGTHRRKLARVLETAEEEGLLTEEARRVLISLLTAQGLKWLNEYMQTEGQKLREQALQATSDAANAANASLAQATAQANRGLEELEKRAADVSAAVTDVVGTGRGVVTDARVQADLVAGDARDAAASTAESLEAGQKSVQRQAERVGEELAATPARVEDAVRPLAEETGDLAKTVGEAREQVTGEALAQSEQVASSVTGAVDEVNPRTGRKWRWKRS